MNPIKFCKFHGFGNDYIVFESEDLRGVSSIGNFAENIKLFVYQVNIYNSPCMPHTNGTIANRHLDIGW